MITAIASGAVTLALTASAAAALVAGVRREARHQRHRRVRCACGHPIQAHEHYRRGRECALCQCGHPRRVPPSGEVAWWAVMRAVNGPPPPSRDPYVVTDPKTPQQGDSRERP